jgi:hypothetical protein
MDNLTREEIAVVLPGVEVVIAELAKDRRFFAAQILDPADRDKIVAEYDANLKLARSARRKLTRSAA